MSSALDTSFPLMFHDTLTHGAVVAVGLPLSLPEVSVPEAIRARLHPEEWQHAESLRSVRRLTWIGGRLALRAALERHGAPASFPVLSNDRGAPTLPTGFVGSVSHKRSIAVALVAPDAGARIGVDVEELSTPRTQIARRILTEEELARWSSLPEVEQWPQLLLWFSAKEALYKALDPYVRRYVGFTEVELRSIGPNRLRADLLTADLHGFEAEGEWTRVGGHLLTAFAVRTLR